MAIKKEYIYAGVGSLLVFAFLYYRNRLASSVVTSGGGAVTSGGNTVTGGDGATDGGAVTEDIIIDDEVFAVTTPSSQSSNIPTTSPTFNVALARKQCSLKGGTWVPNSSGGGRCINIPAPTSGSVPTGSISAPIRTPTSSTTSTPKTTGGGAYSGGGGGGMALNNIGGLYGGYGTNVSSYSNELGDNYGGSGNINIININSQY